jgi:phage shock protein PspC (stress-responsive transcriptional regulator)
MNDILGQSGGKPPSRSFRLDKQNGKVFGVCAAIGNYFGVDTMLVRVGFVLATLLGLGSPVLIYLAIALIAD